MKVTLILSLLVAAIMGYMGGLVGLQFGGVYWQGFGTGLGLCIVFLLVDWRRL